MSLWKVVQKTLTCIQISNLGCENSAPGTGGAWFRASEFTIPQDQQLLRPWIQNLLIHPAKT
jgi:hypothetical protein